MKYIPLYAADQIHHANNHLDIKRWKVQHELFRNFCFEIRTFERKLGDLSKDNYWIQLLRALRHYRFQLTVAPLPFNYLGSRGFEIEDTSRKHLANCESVYPAYSGDANKLLEMFNKLIRCEDNPNLELIASIVDSNDFNSIAIVILKSNLLQSSERVLRSDQKLNRMEILGVSQLRSEVCYSDLIVLGPIQWFPEYIVMSPRAPQLHLVTFSWLTNYYKREPVFVGLAGTPRSSDAKPRTEKVEIEQLDVTMDPDELIDIIDWEQVKRRAISRTDGMLSQDGYIEDVEAWLFLLEGDQVVPLDASEEAKVTVIDFGQTDKPRVLKIPIREVEPETFILLRTEGGGEYIVEAANSILGLEERKARDTQQHWKSLLRERISPLLSHERVYELKKRGSMRASEANIRNWMSYRSIRTQDYSDFRAIMDFIGLSDKAEEYWGIMEMIVNAHLRAGQLIRKLLLSRILQADVKDAERLGIIEFELPATGAGSLTAFRVKEIYGDPIQVPFYRLGHVFSAGGI